MTANQLVAYNLRRARKLRGDLTQEQAAELLEPYLGARWSKATFSAAESSVTSDRVREFSADEILAFAAAFDLEVAWFFIPPIEEELRGEIRARDAKVGLDTAGLLDRIAAPVDKPAEGDATVERLIELYDAWPADIPEGERRVARMFGTRLAAILAGAQERFVDEVSKGFRTARKDTIATVLGREALKRKEQKEDA